MSLGAVSANYYSPTIQYRYFDTTISDEQITSLMQQYGITATGNADIDLEELYDAMYASAQATSNKTVSNAQKAQEDAMQQAQQPTINVPWANLMIQAGLSVSGDFKKDYQAFNDKIFQMKISATSPQDKAIISQLISQAEIVFVQPDNNSASFSPIKSASGSDILAMLNKMYFFG